MTLYDILVIGGGASGMMAAITAKSEAPHMSVAVLEGQNRVGKKLLTTGNGRCNLTNTGIDISRYHSESPDLVKLVLDAFDKAKTEEFFGSLGILFKEGENGKLFPFSLQAASVVNALRLKCESIGVEIITDAKVEKISKELVVKTAQGDFKGKAVIVACGGCSAKNTGSDGSGFELLRSLGHSCTTLYPAITPIRTETAPIKAAKGAKTVCALRAQSGDEVRTEFGEVLFTEYGISGPPVLQLSGFAASHKNVKISLDMLPEMTQDELFKYVFSRKDNVFEDRMENLFLGLLPKPISLIVLKYCGMNVNDSCIALEKRSISKLVNAVKALTLDVTGVCGYDSAQVTAGGIRLSEFDSFLCSKVARGVFACGEVLDVYGDCGGFNLQWAWSSGHIAGRAASLFAGKNV